MPKENGSLGIMRRMRGLREDLCFKLYMQTYCVPLFTEKQLFTCFRMCFLKKIFIWLIIFISSLMYLTITYLQNKGLFSVIIWLLSLKKWEDPIILHMSIFSQHTVREHGAIILFWYLGNWDKGGPNSITHDHTDPRRKRENTYLKNMNWQE